MERSLKAYKQYFEQIPAEDTLTQVKAFIEQHMDSWALEDEGLIIDLLDDTNVTAEDIIDTLMEMVSFEEGNAAFKNAVLAMHLSLEKQRLSQAKSISEEDFDELEGDTDMTMPFFPSANDPSSHQMAWMS